MGANSKQRVSRKVGKLSKTSRPKRLFYIDENIDFLQKWYIEYKKKNFSKKI